MRRFLSFRSLAILLLGAVAGSAQSALTTVRAVRALTRAEATSGRAVRLTGVVTVRSGWKNSFFFQDNIAGISVDPLDPALDLHAGQRITLQGVTAPGSFAPVIHAQHVVLRGRAALPAGRVHTMADLVGGAQDSQWISIRGTVRSQDVKTLWNNLVFTLSVDTGSGVIVTVRIRDFNPMQQPNFVGASIDVSGVCGTLFNDRRQFLGLRLFVSNVAAINVLRPAPADPFNRPLQPLDSLLQFNPQGNSSGLLRIAGTVTWQNRGNGFYLQAGDQAVFVDWKIGDTPAVNSAVEVVGYPSTGHGSTRMQAAFVRILGKGRTVKPRSLAAANIITTRDGFTITPSEGLLIRVNGKLLGEVPGIQQTTLLLQDGNELFTARIPSSDEALYPQGTVLSIAGVSTIDYDDYSNEPSAFYLQVRSPADITVAQRAPWWNAQHAARVAEALAFIVILLLAIILLSRQATLRSLATTDALTGLANRRTLLRSIEHARRTNRRTQQTLRLLFIDIDRFKEINDRYGHRCGDIALKQVAQLLREAFSESYSIGRIGGDEFVVVVRHISSKECEFRIGTALARINSSGVNAFQLSLSTGILECSPHDDAVPVEDLLERADALMYRQKRVSRDHPVATAPVPQPAFV